MNLIKHSKMLDGKPDERPNNDPDDRQKVTFPSFSLINVSHLGFISFISL